MIRMGVRDEQRRHLLGRLAPDLRKPLNELAVGQACIDEQTSRSGLEKKRVASASAPENGHPHSEPRAQLAPNGKTQGLAPTGRWRESCRVDESDLEYDSVLLVSFGGPESRADVMPFLENVVRGKNVPPERLKEVAAHYNHFDGKSPINDQNRALIAAIESELREHQIDLPVYWGNRNWHPFLTEALEQMRDDGKRRALAFFTSAYSSYSGCRQYRENIEKAREEVGEGAPRVDKLRTYFNHPGFIEANVDHLLAALETLPKARRECARVAFTAHSIPEAMAETCDYVEQLQETARLVAEGARHDRWQLVYQSRSGPPHVPWLAPDILDHLDALAQINVKDVVIAPIGFISDHMEVVWDLDHEARDRANELGITLTRASTVGTHPAFVSMIRELIEERLGKVSVRPALGKLGPAPDQCPPDCCKYQPRVSRPAEAT